MKTIFLLSSNPQNLSAALGEHPFTATVEAEFGDTVVHGNVLTMAHHGIHADQPAPCSYPNRPQGERSIYAVGLSHVDLDSLGGCAAILGMKPEVEGFWELAAFVDVNGPHKLGESGATPENIRRLYAFWAWSNTKKTFPPRDGSVLDVSKEVETAITVLNLILYSESEDLLASGDAFRAAEDKLNAESFVEMSGCVVVRVAPGFTNHLYVGPDGRVAMAVVAFKTTNASITISFADPSSGQDAKKLVQYLFGPEAGGHIGIAGSPRDRRMSLSDLNDAFEITRNALAGALTLN